MSFLLPHCGVIVSILTSSVVDHGFPSDKTKDYEIASSLSTTSGERAETVGSESE
jgi:hypothetical protein